MVMVWKGDKVQMPETYDDPERRGVVQDIQIVTCAADGKKATLVKVKITKCGERGISSDWTEWFDINDITKLP